MKNNGYIKINKKILEWEWYKDKNTFKIFIHCLLKANWKNGNFQGKDISRGSFVTSIAKLVEETGLSTQEVRTSLKHLISTNEIKSETYSKFRIITIINYDAYQLFDLTSNQQATNKVKLNVSTKYLTTLLTQKFVVNKGNFFDCCGISNNVVNIQEILQHFEKIENLTTIEEIRNNSYLVSLDINARVYKCYEENIGLISPYVKKVLDEWLLVFDESIVNQAIITSVESGVGKINYIIGILKNWKDQNVKTLHDIKFAPVRAKKSEDDKSVEIFDYDWLEEDYEGN